MAFYTSATCWKHRVIAIVRESCFQHRLSILNTYFHYKICTIFLYKWLARFLNRAIYIFYIRCFRLLKHTTAGFIQIGLQNLWPKGHPVSGSIYSVYSQSRYSIVSTEWIVRTDCWLSVHETERLQFRLRRYRWVGAMDTLHRTRPAR